MRKVLIVAYFFPPLGGIGSARAVGLAKHLPEYGWEPTVLAPRNGAYYRDRELTFPEEHVARSGSLELSRLGKRLLRTGGDDVRAASVGAARGTLRHLVRSFVYYPDAQAGWYAPAVVRGYRLMRKSRFDVIFSSAYPVTAHLVARRLHRSLGVPWVAEFRDPWVDRLPDGSLAQRRARRLELSLAREANAVVMPSPSWAERYGRRWGRRVNVVMNGFEPLEKQGAAPPRHLVLSYLGSYYPARQNLQPVWEAVRARLARDPHERITLRFIGELHPVVARQLRESGVGDHVEVTGYRSNREARRCLDDSTALLLAGPRDMREDLKGEIAGKLFEYLASDVPIIYVGQTDADAAAVLSAQPGCFVLGPDDVDGVERALQEASGLRVARDVSRYTRSALAGQLAQILEQVSSQ